MAVIQPLPPAPSTSDPTNFDAKADAMLGALPGFVIQANQLEMNLTAAAAPGGIMIPYVFDAAPGDSDPGDGKFRIGGATQNTATVWRLDTKSGVGVDVAALLDALASISTSTVKGQIRAQKAGDPTKWILANFTAVATAGGGGYRNLAVAVIASSSANPFTDLDACVLTVTAKGDKGDQGPAALWTGILSAVTVSGSPTAVTFSSIPSGYSDLHFKGALTLSTASTLSVAISANGTAFTQEMTIAGGSGTTQTFDVFVFDYQSAEPWLMLCGNNTAIGSAPAALPQNTNLYAARLAGPVTTVRFTAVAGTMSGGSFLQPRAR